MEGGMEQMRSWMRRCGERGKSWYVAAVVRYPLAILMTIVMSVALITLYLTSLSVIADTGVEAYVVRNTPLSNRKHSVEALPRHLLHNPNGTYFPVSTPAPPHTPPPPSCSTRDRTVHLLLQAPSGNILTPEGLQAACRVVEGITNLTYWHDICSGLPSSYPQCKATSCERPVWVLDLPHIIETHLSPSLKRVLSVVSSEEVRDKIGLLSAHCQVTGLPPCIENARKRIGCASEKCDEPCIVEGFNLCSFLGEADVRGEDLSALTVLQEGPAIPSGGTCSDMNVTHARRIVAAAQVLAAWSKRSSTASRMLPMLGGRVLFDKAATEAAARRDAALGEMQSGSTRVVLKLRDVPVRDAQHVGELGVRYAEKEGLELSWREWDAFRDEAEHQLLLDGRWAVGSICFVLIYTVYYSRSLFLSVGAVMGVCMALPIALFVYRVVLGFEWLGVLHLIGLFLVAGIGADDFFVILAHWREARRGSLAQVDLQQRVWWTLSHSLTTVAATSFTTAAAFAGNLTSSIVPIKLFGVFMAALILALLVLVGLWFPPLLVLHHRTLTCCAPPPPSNRRESSEGTELELAFCDPFEKDDEQANGSSSLLSVKLEEEEETPVNEGQTPLPGAGSAASPDTDRRDSYESLLSDFKEKERETTSTWFVRGLLSHPKIAAALVVATIVTAVPIAAHLPGPNGDLTVWPSYFNQARYMKAEMEMDNDVGLADLRMVWGIHAADDGEMWVPSSHSGLHLADGFDPTTEAAQMWFLDLCRALETREGELEHRVRPGTVHCPYLAVQRWLESGEVTAAKVHALLALSTDPPEDRNISSLPLPPTLFADVLAAWWYHEGEGGFAGAYYHPYDRVVRHPKPSAIAVWVGTTTDWQKPYDKVMVDYTFWETWLNNRTASGPREVLPGFHSAGGAWVLMETQIELKRTATTSIGVSVALALVVLLVTTANPVLALTAVACIAAAVASCIAFMTLVGWNLGVIESICLTIAVGMSCDYTVHLTATHTLTLHESTDDDNFEAMRSSLLLVASPVTAAAITSIGSAIFLLGCKMVFLSKFGAFVVVTLLGALFYALVGYPSALLLLGRKMSIKGAAIKCCTS